MEGFDNPNVSVVGIARNVQSSIIFAQFVGRAIRKIRANDPIKATIVSDKFFNQKVMRENFEVLPENEEPNEEDDI